MIALVAAAAAWSATLTTTGFCGGPVTITGEGLTPGGRVVLLSAPETGAAVTPGGRCAGLELGLSEDYTVRKFSTADGSGTYELTVPMPPAACGAALQMVDVATCSTTDVAIVLTGEDADGDGYDAALDCNDNNENSYPGAMEICDNQQNDCDAAWTGDDGIVTWYDTGVGGGFVDLTDGFARGTEGAPYEVVLSVYVGGADGVVVMCDGTYHNSIYAASAMGNVHVTKQNGNMDVTLDNSAGTGPAVRFENTGSAGVGNINVLGNDVSTYGVTFETRGPLSVGSGPDTVFDRPIYVSDLYSDGPSSIGFTNTTQPGLHLDLTNNASTIYLFGGTFTGGDLVVTGLFDSTVLNISNMDFFDMSSVQLTNLVADVGNVDVLGGSGWQVSGSGTVLDMSSFSFTNTTSAISQSGGELILFGGTISGVGDGTGNVIDLFGATGTIQNVDVLGGNSLDGALTLSDSTVTMTDSLFDGNISTGNAGGAKVGGNSSLTCTKTGADPAGFYRNDGGVGGAVTVVSGITTSTLTSNGCDWGALAGNDNEPVDVALVGGSTYDFGDNATFSCISEQGNRSCM